MHSRTHVIITFICFLLISLCYLKVASHFEKVAASDPDRYLHLALAKITQENGRIKTLPQVENLGWNLKFIEKNYLYTLLTTQAYRLNGEAGVIFLGKIFTLLVALTFLLNLANIKMQAGGLLLALIPLASDDFASRISLLRPHVLALALFLLLVYSLRTRKPLLCLISCLLFSLSYHALYVPLSLLMIATLFIQEADLRKSILCSGVGLFLGVLCNPYFPSQLHSTRNSFRMAFNLSGVQEGDRPIEILPLGTDEFLMHFSFYLGVLAFAWFQYRILEKKQDSEKSQTNFKILLLSASFFWFLGVYSRRAFEYAIPLTLLLIPALTPFLRRPVRVYVTLTFLALIFNLKPAMQLYARPVLPSYTVAEVLQAIQKIPKDLKAKVFNCEWANGPFILYQRPKLSFIDLTDPVLLNDYAPKDYALRELLKSRQIDDAYRLIHDHFKSDYVLCDHPNVIAQMEEDSRFKRLYPDSLNLHLPHPTGFTTLYALRK